MWFKLLIRGRCGYLGAIRETFRRSQFEHKPNIDHLGVVGMGHGLNGWQAVIATFTSSTCGGPVGFETRNPGCDLGFLSQPTG